MQNFTYIGTWMLRIVNNSDMAVQNRRNWLLDSLKFVTGVKRQCAIVNIGDIAVYNFEIGEITVYICCLW